MISITLNRSEDQPVYQPNDQVAGKVAWAGLEEADHLEVRLIWYTTGKGDRDAQYVDVKTVAAVSPEGQTDFQFVAPDRPNSFSGKLIAIEWGIEVIAFPQREAAQALFAIQSATGEIVLGKVKDEDVFWEGALGRFGKLKKAQQ